MVSSQLLIEQLIEKNYILLKGFGVSCNPLESQIKIHILYRVTCTVEVVDTQTFLLLLPIVLCDRL